MTAVEWLAEQLYPAITLNSKIIDSFVGVAKEMEKQQIIDAHSNGYKNLILGDDKVSEQYFAKTYGSKGSDGHELDDDIPPTSQYFPTSSQTEISDEEIEKAAEDWQEFRQGAGKQSFEQGAKWYREQLKCKGNGNK